MGVLGAKVRKTNLPIDTFFGKDVNLVTGSATPSGTPAAGTAFVWFDASIKKWRVKYDDATIESLGVGLSGAVAHKDTHKSGGSDPFVKGDNLDAAARYLEDRADPASDSKIIWLQDGGSEIRYWDDQGSPVKQTLATLGTAQTLANKILGSTCDISAALAVDTTVAKLAVANIFIEAQEVQISGAEPLVLSTTQNTATDENAIKFRFRNSTPALFNSGWIINKLDDPTAASEDTSYHIWVKNAGSDAEILDISGAGLKTYEPLTVKKNAQKLLSVFRDTSTNQDVWYQAFIAKDSGGNETDYALIVAQITDPTDGSEDGRLILYTRRAGTITAAFLLGEGGDIAFGQNLGISMQDTGITSTRAFTFPNRDALLIGVGAKSGSPTTVSNTVTETDILNYSVGANQIGANGIVRFKISGYILQNQVTGTTWRFRIKFGGTEMYNNVTGSIAQSANKMAFRIEGELYNKNATNAQGVSGHIAISDNGSIISGIGGIGDDEITSWSPIESEGADAAQDTTTSKTLQVTVEHSVANANVQTVVKNYLVEVLT